MDDIEKYLFANACIVEEKAYKMYIDLARVAKNNIIRKLFQRLAEEEARHKAIFAKVNLDTLKMLNNDSLYDLNIMDDLKDVEFTLDDIEDINKAIDFAIEQEQKAFDDYNKILKYLPFNDFRNILKEIAQQELSHKAALYKVKSELNIKDWF